jgi:hypothetical protein
LIDIKKFIIIPVYNDWKSLNKLLFKLDNNLSKKFSNIEVIVINDNSSEKIAIKRKKFFSIKNIKIITLSKNIGSQRAIFAGIQYLAKIKKDFVVTIMDSDGEDDPAQVSKMINAALMNPDKVITSNRKKRKESKIIIFMYKIHLLFTFFLTFKWISFGNFTSFKKNNLKKLLSNNSSNFAHSSSVIKNCEIIRLYAKRKKRYFDKSKLSLLSLIEHSLRVNTVFLNRITLVSGFYILLSYIFFQNNYFLFIVLFLITLNLLFFTVKIKFDKKMDYKISKKIIKF